MPFQTLYCVCEQCEEETKAFTTADGPYMFIDKIRDAILRFKFTKAVDYAETFGVIMAAHLVLRLDKIDFDVVVPIPISAKRLKKRGYNQTTLLAKVIAKELNIDFDNTSLIKIKETEVQSTLSSAARRKNLKNAFNIKGDNLKGKKVLLIDDVKTTGATLNEAEKVILKKGKAKSVYQWVFARAE